MDQIVTEENPHAAVIAKVKRLFDETFQIERRRCPIEVWPIGKDGLLPWGGAAEIKDYENNVFVADAVNYVPEKDARIEITGRAAGQLPFLLLQGMTVTTPDAPVLAEQVPPTFSFAMSADGKGFIFSVKTRCAIAFLPPDWYPGKPQ